MMSDAERAKMISDLRAARKSATDIYRTVNIESVRKCLDYMHEQAILADLADRNQRADKLHNQYDGAIMMATYLGLTSALIEQDRAEFAALIDGY